MRKTDVQPNAMFIFALLSFITLGLSNCGPSKDEQKLQAPKVVVAQPEKRIVTGQIVLTGNTQAAQIVQLTARVGGFLKSVNFQDGDIVNEGDTLFVIEPEPYEAKVKLAEASVSFAEAELNRASLEFQRQLDLAKKKATSQSEVEKWQTSQNSALAKLNEAKANLDLARINLGYTQIKAPFAGKMDRRLKDPGSLVGVSEATVLSTIVRVDPIYAYFNVNEKDLVKIRAQKNAAEVAATEKKTVAVFLAIEGEQGFPHQGRLDFASVNLDPGTGTMLLRASFENPRIADGALILPGMFVRLRIPSTQGKEALVVPEKALGTSQSGRTVLVVNSDNIVVQKTVKAGGLQDDGMRVIEEGLNGEEWIVVDGLMRARPGFPVTPEKKGEEAKEVQARSDKTQ